ncbi:uncharacterized protein [Lepeophtheirus salmonis]|uniref:uncharacterized protein n=1 Tax=Lepeophtheirus salmonis TaxID=72036 RepID=UPI001AE2E934|nr:shematrin-like protein 1 isoform X1 [Lepeophtheirus salmonis]XP_040567005.1 shematrin-like protein 1 isoform X2 [Lepeophtheirus salmonis]
MKTFFTIVAVLVASAYAAPEAEADPHHTYGGRVRPYGYGGYHGRPAHGYGYGRPHYLGKREAEPTADPEADPHHGYYGYPSYGHGSYGSYGFRPPHYLGKREAEPTADADPGHGYASYGRPQVYGGYHGYPSYGYGSYGSYGPRPHHYLGKREAEPISDPSYGYTSSYGYRGHPVRPSYGYSGYYVPSSYGSGSYGYGPRHYVGTRKAETAENVDETF